jgi:hypothetical protein
MIEARSGVDGTHKKIAAPRLSTSRHDRPFHGECAAEAPRVDHFSASAEAPLPSGFRPGARHLRRRRQLRHCSPGHPPRGVPERRAPAGAARSPGGVGSGAAAAWAAAAWAGRLPRHGVRSRGLVTRGRRGVSRSRTHPGWLGDPPCQLAGGWVAAPAAEFRPPWSAPDHKSQFGWSRVFRLLACWRVGVAWRVWLSTVCACLSLLPTVKTAAVRRF